MSRLDFEWSFRPFLTVIRCIGVPLNHHFDPPLQEQDGYLLLWHRCRYWVIIGFALLAFFLNILSQLSAITFGWMYFTFAYSNNYISTTGFVTEFINIASHATITVGGHLMALAFTLPNWPRLTKILQEMEDKLLCSADLKRFRVVCRTGLLALMVDVTVMILIMVMTIPSGQSLIHYLLHISTFMFPIYTLTHGFLFYSLCRVSNYTLQSLAEQVKTEAERQKTKNRKAKTSQWWSRLMSRWKGQYNCITQFIDEINYCFGHIFLLAVPCCFVRMINNSFHVVGILLGNESWLFGIHNTSFLIKDFVQLNIIAYTSHQIRQEAIRLAKHLRMLQFDDARLKSQIHFLKMEVYSSLPQITAVGLIDFNCGLVITFVSSTLTYLIILCQFQWSETSTFINSNQTST